MPHLLNIVICLFAFAACSFAVKDGIVGIVIKKSFTRFKLIRKWDHISRTNGVRNAEFGREAILQSVPVFSTHLAMRNFVKILATFSHHSSDLLLKKLAINPIQENEDDAIRRGNAYIDQLLKDMFESDTDKFDPYEMEDSVVGFNKKVLFVNVSGEAKLHDGTLKGLSTLHRTDDCALHEKDGRLRVEAKLGAGVLNFLYSGSAKFMNFGPTITVHGDLAFVEVELEFTVDAKTGKNGKLTKFAIDDMRDMRVWVTGLGPISWAMNPVIKAVTKIFKRILKYFLENRVQKYIDNRLPNYQFPVEGGGITDSPLTTPTEPEETTQTTEELTTLTSEPEITTVEQTTVTTEPEITTVEQTATTTEPEITTVEQTTITAEPEITTPEQTTQPPEPEITTQTPEEPVTTVSEEPETTISEEPETQTSEIIETTVTEEPETQTPEVTETTVSEEPETQIPEETETPSPEEPSELEE